MTTMVGPILMAKPFRAHDMGLATFRIRLYSANNDFLMSLYGGFYLFILNVFKIPWNKIHLLEDFFKRMCL